MKCAPARHRGRNFELPALALLALVACGGSDAIKPSAASGPPLHLSPATDLAQAAGVSWLVDVEPRSLMANAELLPALDALFPRTDVTAFTERTGLDPLALDELVVASYPAATEEESANLYLARGTFDPRRLEALFRARADAVEGRAIDRADETGEETGSAGSPSGPIVRLWGTVRGQRAQLAVFGRRLAAVEVGRFGVLRVAELFAQERLKRASPALRAGALARVSELIRDKEGDPPVRAFALGPFEGESGRTMGGLLAASTAAAISGRPSVIGGQAAFKVVLALTSGWEGSATEAADKLRAAFDALSATALGRLSGLDHPLEQVHVDAMKDALRLTVALDALALARGARAAMGAEAREIMSY